MNANRRRAVTCAFFTFACAAMVNTAFVNAAQRKVVVAYNDETSGDGFLRAIDVDPPWAFASPPVAVGRSAIVRTAFGLIYAVSPVDGTISVVDPATWTATQTYSLGPASQPQDIAVVSPSRAYVTRAGATQLLRLDLPGGAMQNVVDLAMFADADGVPDLSMMAIHEDRLFVQIRRFDTVKFTFELPAMIAVVDLTNEQLVDVDPQAPGVQAIELAGRAPKFKMQVNSSVGRLYVGASGAEFDAGGIEAVNLATLQPAGLLVEEADGLTGADIGAFVMVSPLRGFLTFTTDFALSSHLTGFTSGGLVEYFPYVTVGYFVPTLVADLPTNQMFLLHSGGVEHGVHVFDTTSGAQLTDDPIPLTGQPSDLVLLCNCPEVECGSELTCAQAPAMGSGGMIAFGSLLLIAALSVRRASARPLRGKIALPKELQEAKENAARPS